MSRTAQWTLWALMALLTVACSDDGSSGGGDADTDADSDADSDSDTSADEVPEIQPVGSCMTEQQGVQVCIAATGTSWTEDLAEAHCTDTVEGGVYSADPCPVANCEGICVPAADQDDGYETVYLLYTVEGIPLDYACSTFGTWHPGCE